MVAKHYYRNDDGDLELVPTVLRWGWTLKESSEEGEAPIVTVVVDDPDMSLDFFGHRRWIVRDDETEEEWGDDVIYSGFVQKQTIAHKGGDITNPLGRVWTIELVDMNTLWTNRILVGSDTDRDEESDVERMTWLVGTEEMGYFDDISLISSLGSVDMDADDTRGRTTGSVADSCAQQSGKNWWIGARNTGIFVWYGKDEYEGYDSPLTLSNNPAHLDMDAVDAGTATTYPLGADTELARDPQRIYSGVYGEYQNGAVYVTDSDTMEFFSLSGRDIASPMPEIRTATKAKARARRLLNDSDSQELVFSTTVVIPARKVSQIRTGMRITIVMTHGTDGFNVAKYCRILNASPSPISNGSWYNVAIEAIPVGDAPVPCVAGTELPLDGDYYIAPGSAPSVVGVSWSHDPADVLPITGFVNCGSSSYPSPGSPTWYGIDVDRGVSPDPVAWIRYGVGNPDWDLVSTGPSMWASDDGSSFTNISTIAEHVPLEDGAPYFKIPIPEEWRGARYFRFRSDDLFVSGFWFGTTWFADFTYAACVG